jgi:hypothetical protein
MTATVETEPFAARPPTPAAHDWAAEPIDVTPDQPAWIPQRREASPRTWLAVLVLAGIIGCIVYLLSIYYAPSHGGTDQDGYLLTGRLMLDQHVIGFTPTDPYQFVGRMLVVTDAGRVYTKYPVGFPLFASAARAIGGMDAVYLVNPACYLLACLMSFWLFRTITSNFIALLGVIWLACNPVALILAFDANSHASSLLCVVVGFWGLLKWSKMHRTWIGFVGGFALGYAAIIRYTEFLLIVPLLFAMLAAAEMRPWRLHKHLAPLIGWAIPILFMGCVCWACFGAPWRTGYSLDHEQTGFGLKYLLGDATSNPPREMGNWETLFVQINHIGMILLWPLWIVGMVAMFGKSWRMATLLALWIVPPTLLYLCYYWAPAGEDHVWYLRFFLTAFPGMMLCALWVLDRAQRSLGPAAPVALAALTGLAALLNFVNIAPGLENQMEGKLALTQMRDRLAQAVPPNQGNVVFVDEGVGNYLDSIGGYHLEDLGIFRPNTFVNLKRSLDNQQNPEDPSPLQRSRTLALMHLLGHPAKNGELTPKPQDEVDKMELTAITDALDAHKRVAFIIHGNNFSDLVRDNGKLNAKLLTSWDELPPLPRMAAGVLTRWNNGNLVQLPPQNQHGPPWRVYEVTRK